MNDNDVNIKTDGIRVMTMPSVSYASEMTDSLFAEIRKELWIALAGTRDRWAKSINHQNVIVARAAAAVAIYPLCHLVVVQRDGGGSRQILKKALTVARGGALSIPSSSSNSLLNEHRARDRTNPEQSNFSFARPRIE